MWEIYWCRSSGSFKWHQKDAEAQDESWSMKYNLQAVKIYNAGKISVILFDLKERSNFQEQNEFDSNKSSIGQREETTETWNDAHIKTGIAWHYIHVSISKSVWSAINWSDEITIAGFYPKEFCIIETISDAYHSSKEETTPSASLFVRDLCANNQFGKPYWSYTILKSEQESN